MLILGKLLILTFCAFLQFHSFPINISNIGILLVVFILTSLPLIIKTNFLGQKGLSLLTNLCWCCYLISALFFPALHCYLPLALFDIWSLRLFTSGTLFCIAFISKCVQDYTAGQSPAECFFLLFLSTLAVLLQHIVSSNEQLICQLKLLRDSSKERELLIEEKNRSLREQQDTELHMATLRERNRIAREIHDNVGHMLTRSILQVGAIKTINSNETLKEPLEGLHETLNTAMTNIRVSVHDLHDESIDLLSAIREITDPVDTITIHLDYDMGKNVPKKLKYCFISIIKEAVNNVLKHSNATEMEILVQEHPAFYQLLIQDNGTNIHKSSNDGIGLTNMKDRVNAFRGNIKISTEQGFKILISIIKSNLTE